MVKHALIKYKKFTYHGIWDSPNHLLILIINFRYEK
jgi:hypothetical protein